MRGNFEFSNLLGATYRKGPLRFTKDDTTLLSPVGSRIAAYDLKNATNTVLPISLRSNIILMDLSEDNGLLALVTEQNVLHLVNFPALQLLEPTILSAPSTPNPTALKFSPDGRVVAVARDNGVRFYTTPDPAILQHGSVHVQRVFQVPESEITCIEWSRDSQVVLLSGTGTRVYVVALHAIQKREDGTTYKLPVVTLSGHRGPVAGAYWLNSQVPGIISVGRDRTLRVWRLTPRAENRVEAPEEDEFVLENPHAKRPKGEDGALAAADAVPDPTRQFAVLLDVWRLAARYHMKNPGSVCSLEFQAASGILAVGFTRGGFAVYRMRGHELTPLQAFSVSAQSIAAVSINSSGALLALGVSALGQLLVWEWETQSYLLKQQAHDAGSMNCVAYSHDGALLATGGDDGKVKIWKGSSGNCFFTFREHTAPVTALQFNNANAVFSASKDGTIRAFDTVRYRQFRIYTTPTPEQFSCLAFDPGFEFLAAGASTSFQVYLWNVRTGQLLDALVGHEGPVSGVSFCPTRNVVATCSWDRSLRLWTFLTEGEHRSKDAAEVLPFPSEVLALCWAPSGNEVSVVTMSGIVEVLEVPSSAPPQEKHGGIDVGRDMPAGYRTRVGLNVQVNENVDHRCDTIAYSPDGSLLLCGGSTKWITMYDVSGDRPYLVNRWTVTDNVSFEGVVDRAHHTRITEAGNLDTFDANATESDEEEQRRGKLKELPGVQSGPYAKKPLRKRIPARSKQVLFAPHGSEWAAATTDGLLVFSLDAGRVRPFQPRHLFANLTPQFIRELAKTDVNRALVAALQFGDGPITKEIFYLVDVADIEYVCDQLPTVYLRDIGELIAAEVATSRQVEYCLRWALAYLQRHGQFMERNRVEMGPCLRSLQKGIHLHLQNLQTMAEENKYTIQYLAAVGQIEYQPPDFEDLPSE